MASKQAKKALVIIYNGTALHSALIKYFIYTGAYL